MAEEGPPTFALRRFAVIFIGALVFVGIGPRLCAGRGLGSATGARDEHEVSLAFPPRSSAYCSTPDSPRATFTRWASKPSRFCAAPKTCASASTRRGRGNRRSAKSSSPMPTLTGRTPKPTPAASSSARFISTSAAATPKASSPAPSMKRCASNSSPGCRR